MPPARLRAPAAATLVRRAFAGLLSAGAVAAAALALPAVAGAATPPGGRAYELVSPLHASGVDWEQAWVWGDGDRALLSSVNDSPTTTLATRGATGWSTARMEMQPPGASWWVRNYLADATPDFSRVLVKYTRGRIGNPGSFDGLARYERGAWTTVGEELYYAGGSQDLARLVVQRSTASADPFPGVESRSGVYLWDEGAVTAVGDDAPLAAACGADATGIQPADIPGTSDLGVPLAPGPRSGGQRGVSQDGRTIVLLSRPCTVEGVAREPHVHVWRDGVTVDVSAPLDDAAPDVPSTFVGNALDGSAVFFTTAAQLEAGDLNGSTDLYRYDVASGRLARVSAAATDGDGPTGPVTLAMSSRDGRAAWFVSQLPTGTALWSWTQGRPTRVVALGGAGAFPLDSAYSNDWVNGTASATQSTMTADGAVLAWLSDAPIGGYAGGSPQAMRATRDSGVVCVSCSADGSGMDSISFGSPLDAISAPLDRMSADGETVAFQTFSAGDPHDVNEALDVYVWQDGVRSLISSGRDLRGARLAGVSGRGDVFFLDGGDLLPGVDDELFKLYVARVGGGFPLPPPECQGDACQGAPTPPTGNPAPGSETHAGPGDAEDPEQSWSADPAVRLRKPTAVAKRRLARGRAVALVVDANAAGRVTATVRVRRGGRWVRAGGAARTVTQAGRVKLTVRLGRGARRQLAARGRLRVQIEVVHGAAVRTATTTFVLERAKTKAGRGR